jgi:SnoaL-like domain
LEFGCEAGNFLTETLRVIDKFLIQGSSHMTNSQGHALPKLSLEDERDITAVIMRFATAVDTRNWPLLRSCFDNEIDVHYESSMRCNDLDELMKIMEDIHQGFGKSLHRNTNIVINSCPGGAMCQTYVNGIFMYPDGSMAGEAEGTYDDFLIRVDGEWKIKKRHFVPIRLRRPAAEGEHVAFPSSKGLL